MSSTNQINNLDRTPTVRQESDKGQGSQSTDRLSFRAISNCTLSIGKQVADVGKWVLTKPITATTSSILKLAAGFVQERNPKNSTDSVELEFGANVGTNFSFQDIVNGQVLNQFSDYQKAHTTETEMELASTQSKTTNDQKDENVNVENIIEKSYLQAINDENLMNFETSPLPLPNALKMLTPSLSHKESLKMAQQAFNLMVSFHGEEETVFSEPTTILEQEALEQARKKSGSALKLLSVALYVRGVNADTIAKVFSLEKEKLTKYINAFQLGDLPLLLSFEEKILSSKDMLKIFSMLSDSPELTAKDISQKLEMNFQSVERFLFSYNNYKLIYSSQPPEPKASPVDDLQPIVEVLPSSFDTFSFDPLKTSIVDQPDMALRLSYLEEFLNKSTSLEQFTDFKKFIEVMSYYKEKLNIAKRRTERPDSLLEWVEAYELGGIPLLRGYPVPSRKPTPKNLNDVLCAIKNAPNISVQKISDAIPCLSPYVIKNFIKRCGFIRTGTGFWTYDGKTYQASDKQPVVQATTSPVFLNAEQKPFDVAPPRMITHPLTSATYPIKPSLSTAYEKLLYTTAFLSKNRQSSSIKAPAPTLTCAQSLAKFEALSFDPLKTSMTHQSDPKTRLAYLEEFLEKCAPLSENDLRKFNSLISHYKEKLNIFESESDRSRNRSCSTPEWVQAYELGGIPFLKGFPIPIKKLDFINMSTILCAVQNNRWITMQEINRFVPFVCSRTIETFLVRCGFKSNFAFSARNWIYDPNMRTYKLQPSEEQIIITDPAVSSVSVPKIESAPTQNASDGTASTIPHQELSFEGALVNSELNSAESVQTTSTITDDEVMQRVAILEQNRAAGILFDTIEIRDILGSPISNTELQIPITMNTDIKEPKIDVAPAPAQAHLPRTSFIRHANQSIKAQHKNEQRLETINPEAAQVIARRQIARQNAEQREKANQALREERYKANIQRAKLEAQRKRYKYSSRDASKLASRHQKHELPNNLPFDFEIPAAKKLRYVEGHRGSDFKAPTPRLDRDPASASLYRSPLVSSEDFGSGLDMHLIQNDF